MTVNVHAWFYLDFLFLFIFMYSFISTVRLKTHVKTTTTQTVGEKIEKKHPSKIFRKNQCYEKIQEMVKKYSLNPSIVLSENI